MSGARTSVVRVLQFCYAVFQLTQGLLLHPYQTMQAVVEQRVFVLLSLLPTIMLAVVTVSWKFVIVPLVQLVLSCQIAPWLPCGWLSVVSDWLVFFCLYWQVLLLYLLFRFGSAWREG